MKAVAGLKMSYQVQQAINGSKGAVIRGFRHDDSDSSLCSHLYTLVRGNRQHRRAFLISLLNLFDDSSVSSPFCFSLCPSEGWIVSHHPSSKLHRMVNLYIYILSPAENWGEQAAVHSRQLGLLPLPDPGGATFYHAPCGYYSVCIW